MTDGSWYSGVPIWSLAESEGMRAACLLWPGSEAKIAGFRPSYYAPAGSGMLCCDQSGEDALAGTAPLMITTTAATPAPRYLRIFPALGFPPHFQLSAGALCPYAGLMGKAYARDPVTAGNSRFVYQSENRLSSPP